MECLICNSTKDTIDHAGMVICRACYNKLFNKCDCCKEVKPVHAFFMHDSKLLRHILSEYGYTVVCTECRVNLEIDVRKSGVIECISCGAMHKYSSKKKEGLCEECDKAQRKCHRCGSWHRSDGMYILEDSLHVCQTCYGANKGMYLSCNKCGTLHLVDAERLYENTAFLCNVCNSKYCSCDHCGVTCLRKNISRVGLDNICNNCLKYKCEECGAVPIRPSRHMDDEGIYCSMCYAKKGRANKQDWNYVPYKFHFHSASGESDKLYLGFENEQIIPTATSSESRRDLSLVLRHYNEKDIYAVFDGSIGGVDSAHGSNGYEIVSHPRTLKSHKDINWSRLFTRDQRMHHTCGMHVHLSRSGLTRGHLLRLMRLVYENPQFCTLIAEREPNEFTQSVSKRFVEEDSAVMYKRKSNFNRRVKVNLCNTHTIELRFFSNVVDQASLMKNLEFSHALYYYTKNSKPSDTNVHSFLLWIAGDTHNLYSNLITFLSNNAKEFSKCV